MKQQLNEVRRFQKLAGIIEESNGVGASFQGKFKDIENPQEFIQKFGIEANNPLTKIVTSYIGDYYNFAITNDGGKFNVYKFRQTAKPGEPVGTFDSVDDAKKAIQKMDK